MKSISLILLLALSMTGCSTFSKTARMDRAYYKQLKQVKIARQKRLKQAIEKQSRIPSPSQPVLPPLGQTVQPAPENQ